MINLRRIKLYTLTAMLLSGVAIATAQQQPSPATIVRGATEGPTRVGFVDIEIVLDNSRAIRAVLGEMDERMSEKAREIDLREREFRRLRFEMDRQERLLSPEERERRRNELVDIQDDISERRFELERDFAAAERSIEPILERIYNVVADVADAEDLDLVLRGEVVIYGRQSADITDKVIEELDKRADEVREAFEAGRPDPTSPAPSQTEQDEPQYEPQSVPQSVPESAPAPTRRRGDNRTLPQLPEENE